MAMVRKPSVRFVPTSWRMRPSAAPPAFHYSAATAFLRAA